VDCELGCFHFHEYVEHLRVLHDHLQTSLHGSLAFHFVLVAHRAQGVMSKNVNQMNVNQMNVKLLVVMKLLDALDEVPS
jgi:hypothetical protein